MMGEKEYCITVVDGIRKVGEGKKIGICRFRYVDDIHCHVRSTRRESFECEIPMGCFSCWRKKKKRSIQYPVSSMTEVSVHHINQPLYISRIAATAVSTQHLPCSEFMLEKKTCRAKTRWEHRDCLEEAKKPKKEENGTRGGPPRKIIKHQELRSPKMARISMMLRRIHQSFQGKE